MSHHRSFALDRSPAVGLLLVLCLSAPAHAQLDLLITGGRVINPETGFDAIADVAVQNGSVVEVGPAPLATARDGARKIINATGHVVAPGFIDLHAHGASDSARRYQARDGVTTALELEWGYSDLPTFIEARRGRSRIHFGASASHGILRSVAIAQEPQARQKLEQQLLQAMAAEEPLAAASITAAGNYQPLPEGGDAELARLLTTQVDNGAIGFGMAHAYYPGATSTEIFETFQLASSIGVPIFTHVPGRGLRGIQEVVANAAATGAALHIVHVNSVSLGAIDAVLALIRGARERGVDVTTEAYPYTAGSTSIQAALFDGDWQRSYGIDYDGLQWQETGERLTRESFELYREQGGVVIIHMMREGWIQKALGEPDLIIASDGMPYAPGAHPRTAGTFARVLGRYVRELGVMTLPEAIRRMTLLPARRLEGFVPQMKRKGRIQAGADADLVVFDPATVLDTATFESGPRFSEGIEWVFVMGTAVVAEGETVEDAFPGQPILGGRGR